MVNSNKLIASLAIVIIFLSSFLIYQTFSGSDSNAVASSFQSLGVEVSPEGNSFKLGVNESKVFSITVLNGTAPYTYEWAVKPSDNLVLIINGEPKNLVKDDSSYVYFGSTLTLAYPTATEEFVTVTASATDANGNFGQSETFIVADPYTSPGYKFDASTASASYIVSADSLGWYRAINGTDGSVISAYSSTNPNTTINGVLALGGIVLIRNGAYTNSFLTVPANATLVAEPSVTGIKYTSISNGAKIDEPNFNAAFGGYSSGSYTIVTNQSSVATTATWYLAFKPDGAIYWSSTNFSYVATDALAVSRSDVVLGSGMFDLSAPIVSTATECTFRGQGQGSIIRVTSGSNLASMINVGNGALKLGWTIKDMVLDGYYSSGALANGIIFYGYDSFIINIKIQSLNGTALQLRGVSSVSRAYNNRVNDVTISNVNGTGLELYYAQDNFVDNYVSSNVGNTINRKANYIHDSGTNWLTRSYIDLSIGQGLYIQDSSYQNVLESYFLGSTREAIFVYASTGIINNIKIGNSWFYENGRESSNTYDQIVMYSPSGQGNISESSIFNSHFVGGTVSRRSITLLDNQNTQFKNNTIYGNTFTTQATEVINGYGLWGWSVHDNIGYPTGYSQFPIYGSRLVDYGNSDGWANTTYTNNGSPKDLYISGTIITLAVNGQTVYSGTGGLVHLNYGDTFTPTFTSMTVVCMIGQ